MKLYPFQQEDVDKLFQTPNRLICNEMGTGKTYEAIALDLAERQGNGMTLVVAPLSTLKSTWEDHYRRLTNLSVITINPKNRRSFIHALELRNHHVYICHWESLRLQDMAVLKKITWNHVIADEVHRIRNRKTAQTQSLKHIKAVHKTGLTGTPVVNSPGDLWSILNWLWPQQYSAYSRFCKEYTESGFDQFGFWKIFAPKNIGKLHKELNPIFTRRRKVEVLRDLPDKYYTTINVDLEPKQRKAYDEMKRSFLAKLETEDGNKLLAAPIVIAQLQRLQQLALAYHDGKVLAEPSTKLDALMELIGDSNGKQFVVFSQFKQAIRLVERRLRTKGISYTRVTGDDSPTKRESGIRDFQAGRNQIFLGTIGAGSEGITLTAADTVVFLDKDWVPSKNWQAEDRLHRVGQKNAVQVIDISANRTVDQYKDKKLVYKTDWIRRMLND